MKYATPVAFEFSSVKLPEADAALKLWSRFLQAVSKWRQRANSRAQLASMSPRLLNDIGLTRAEALVESSKLFWED